MSMKYINRRVMPFVCAAVLALGGTGCASGGSASSEQTSSKATVKPPVEIDESSVPDDKEEQTDNIGQGLKGAYDILTGNKYTYKCTLTTNESDEQISIERYKSGNKLYQAQTTALGKRGFLSDGEKVYEFDYHTYSFTDEGTVLPDIIESVVKENLPQTSAHIDANENETAEEYTYMGDTYITVYDFYFNAQGALLRYTATYSVEGFDDYVETRTMTEFTSSVGDENIFSPAFTTTLTDFSAFSQADRQTYCSDICTKFGITDQMLTANGMSREGFKKISYGDFIGLVYRYSTALGGEDNDK